MFIIDAKTLIVDFSSSLWYAHFSFFIWCWESGWREEPGVYGSPLYLLAPVTIPALHESVINENS